jgi:hypothetical protein
LWLEQISYFWRKFQGVCSSLHLITVTLAGRERNVLVDLGDTLMIDITDVLQMYTDVEFVSLFAHYYS